MVWIQAQLLLSSQYLKVLMKIDIGLVHKLPWRLLDTLKVKTSLITLLRTASILGNGEMQFNYLDNAILIEIRKIP